MRDGRGPGRRAVDDARARAALLQRSHALGGLAAAHLLGTAAATPAARATRAAHAARLGAARRGDLGREVFGLMALVAEDTALRLGAAQPRDHLLEATVNAWPQSA